MHVEAMRTRRGIDLPITVTEISQVTPYFQGLGQDICGSQTQTVAQAFSSSIVCPMLTASQFKKSSSTTVSLQDKALLLICLMN